MGGRGTTPPPAPPCVLSWHCPPTRLTPAGPAWGTWSSAGAQQGTQDMSLSRPGQQQQPVPVHLQRQDSTGRQQVRCFCQGTCGPTSATCITTLSRSFFFFFLLALDFLYVSWAKIHVAGEKDGLWLSLHLYTVRFSGACELVS